MRVEQRSQSVEKQRLLSTQSCLWRAAAIGKLRTQLNSSPATCLLALNIPQSSNAGSTYFKWLEVF